MSTFQVRGARLLAFLVVALAAALVNAAESRPLSFNRDIRPILAENCFACHGFDAKKRQADLRLDVATTATQVREGRVAIRPGKPDESEVWKRIVSTDADQLMPPPSSHKKLSAVQIQTLRRWISEGATYQNHWSFEPLQRPVEPQVQNTLWLRNPIDRFVVAQLEQAGLAPQIEADRPTLIRRVAFALTGLPPSLDEVDQYLHDASPYAYEQMVDRYLSSPRFGEEMARHWLDVARYADTHGLHLDNERTMFAYRDWVISAFNRNLPFDQFTIWQLAGDQLPNPTLEQLTATGFNRCNVTTSEGGSINEEFVYRYAVDRAATTIETWLGLTGGCAVCHDHKYDPLTMRDFYSFYAFFNSAADPAMDGNVNTTAPFEKLPTEAQRSALLASEKRELSAFRAWQQSLGQVNFRESIVDESQSEAIEFSAVLFDDMWPIGTSVKNTSRNASDWVTDPAFGAPSGRRVLRQKNSYFYEDVVQFSLTSWVAPEAGKLEIWLYVDPQYPPQTIALTLPSGNRRLVWGAVAPLDDRAPGPVSVLRGEVPPAGMWHLLSVQLDELGVKSGQRISGITLQQMGGSVCWDRPVIQGKLAPQRDPCESFTVWWLSVGSKVPDDVPMQLRQLVSLGPKKSGDRSRELVEELWRFYRTHVARPQNDEQRRLRDAWQSAVVAKTIIRDAIVGTMTFRDLPQPREAFVMLRGQYDQRGTPVEPATPAFLPPANKSSPDTRLRRLDLARWLVAPEQPLTARVQANRLWQQIFGVGLVKTSFDFGSQGEVPSHPELLDWLACDLRDHHWDLKRFVRQLVTSATFRQQARITPELLARDPENRLLARGTRFRLDAEQIRDNVLFVSGLINSEMGGRGVKLYQPPNIWEPVGYGDSNTRYYQQDHGPALYRRSVYAFLKRTAPPPFMSNFDGPNREQFCARRERSNTPLQALQLLNDVQHFEAARALAERTLLESGPTSAERVQYLYRVVLARQPSEHELRLVRQAFEQQLQMYQADLVAAERVIGIGESRPQRIATVAETAAWTLTANLLLNLDETLTRQ